MRESNSGNIINKSMLALALGLIITVTGCLEPKLDPVPEPPPEITPEAPVSAVPRSLKKDESLGIEEVYGLTIPEVVARFSGQTITRDEFIRELREWQKQIDMQAKMVSQRTGHEMKALNLPRNQQQLALNTVIAQRLLLQSALDAGMVVSDDAVDTRITQATAKLSTDASYRTYLAFYDLTEEEFREKMRRKLLTEAYIDDAIIPCEITEEQIISAYAQLVQADQMTESENADFWSLVVNVDSDANEDTWSAAETQVLGALKRIESGEFFGKVAVEVSTDSIVRQNGGFLERIRSEIMAPQLREVVFSGEIGELSNPFRTTYGWQIVRPIKLRKGGTRTLEDAEEEIYEKLFADCKSGRSQVLLKDLAKARQLEVLYAVPGAGTIGSF